jgi:hypothetical protein
MTRAALLRPACQRRVQRLSRRAPAPARRHHRHTCLRLRDHRMAQAELTQPRQHTKAQRPTFSLRRETTHAPAEPNPTCWSTSTDAYRPPAALDVPLATAPGSTTPYRRAAPARAPTRPPLGAGAAPSKAEPNNGAGPAGYGSAAASTRRPASRESARATPVPPPNEGVSFAVWGEDWRPCPSPSCPGWPLKRP